VTVNVYVAKQSGTPAALHVIMRVEHAVPPFTAVTTCDLAEHESVPSSTADAGPVPPAITALARNPAITTVRRM
jgi:hypothetical protein